MTAKRIMALCVIFSVATVGWWILGKTTSFRSESYFTSLKTQVENLWGTPLIQQAPAFSVQIPGTQNVRWMMPSKNEIRVNLIPDYRKKGLFWYSTYNCEFTGIYVMTNPDPVTRKIRFHFRFPDTNGTYDDFSLKVDNIIRDIPISTREGIREIIELDSGETREFAVSYKTRGLNYWRYQLDRHVGRVRNFSLTAQLGFKNMDYTENGLSPMSVENTSDGMILKWQATDLITRSDIGIVMPEKLNPGPLTSRITYFAPVCLIFFFVLITAIHIMYPVDIHPMHYLFIAAGFFAFHLLLSYLAGLVPIHLSFILSAIISISLVTGYLAGALGKEFPWKIAAAGQFFYLILFSYSFFIEGFTGLTVATGSVITLAVMMKVTAHVDWNQVFSKIPEKTKTSPPPLPKT